METDKNKQDTGSTAGQSNPPPNFNGFDLNGLFSNASFMEWIKPLLSGAGAMTGTYFMWIKPMQEKMDAINAKLTEQDKYIKNLESEIDELESMLTKPSHKTESNSEPLKGTKEDYFEIKNRSERSGNFRKRRNLHL
jgi:hypothetical protein